MFKKINRKWQVIAKKSLHYPPNTQETKLLTSSFSIVVVLTWSTQMFYTYFGFCLGVQDWNFFIISLTHTVDFFNLKNFLLTLDIFIENLLPYNLTGFDLTTHKFQSPQSEKTVKSPHASVSDG
jgi:hypothetical protein